MTLTAGTRVGPYEVREILGAGGMGEVYRARDPRLRRNVAVKVLPERYAASSDRLRRFEREARAAGALTHPNILTIFDVGSQDGRPYLVSELLEGESLDSRLRGGSLGVRQSLDIAVQAARGLAAAHEAGILHRDLKPANLFLTRDGRLKILDFGLAKLAQAEDGVARDASTATRGTEAGRVLGTAPYMSPEQIRDEPLDARSDIFALGAIFYEMVAGHPAFAGDSVSDVMASVLRDEPPALAGLPAGVGALVRRCVEKRREDRFASALAVVASLETLLESSGSSMPNRSTSAAATLIAPRKWPIPRPAIIAAAGAAALIGFTLYGRWRVSEAPASAPRSLAVMYFENLADRTDADSVGRMLAGLVTTELAASEGLNVVSSQRLHDVARQLGQSEGDPDPATATEIARRAGAAAMVLGQVARAGGRMVATVELVEVASGRRLGSYRAEGASTQDVFSMAERLGTQVRSNLTGDRARSHGSLTRRLTASADAYRAYVRGETLMQRWQFDKAVEEFRRAVEIDPEFALAHYRLSIAASTGLGTPAPNLAEGRLAAERAVALADKLYPGERDLVKGNFLYVTGHLADAIPVLEAALARDPDNKEILYVLSECFVHSPRDTDPRHAAALMERVLALDPEYHVVYSHLAGAYALLGEFPKAHEKLDAWESKEPEVVAFTRSLVSALEGRLDVAFRWSERLEGPMFHGWTRGFYALAAGRWDVAEEMVRKYENLRLLQACLDLNLGRFAHARSELRQALPARLEPDENIFGTANALVLRLLADVADLQGDHHAARREAERALEIQPEGPYALYFAGLYALRDRDPMAAEARLRALQRVAKIARGPLAAHYRDALAAEVALARGRPLEALPLLESAVAARELYYDFLSASILPGPAFREALARTHLALGNKEMAANAFEGLVNSGYESHTEPVRRIRALYALGKLRLELGNHAGGREALEKFLELWGKADWDLPEVRDARARLAGTNGDSRFSGAAAPPTRAVDGSGTGPACSGGSP